MDSDNKQKYLKMIEYNTKPTIRVFELPKHPIFFEYLVLAFIERISTVCFLCTLPLRIYGKLLR